MTPETLAELHTIIGRVNGLHAFCLTLAGAQPPATASIAATNLRSAMLRVEADAVASPIPDAHLNEMMRVMEQLHSVLHLASQGQK